MECIWMNWCMFFFFFTLGLTRLESIWNFRRNRFGLFWNRFCLRVCPRWGGYLEGAWCEWVMKDCFVCRRKLDLESGMLRWFIAKSMSFDAICLRRSLDLKVDLVKKEHQQRSTYHIDKTMPLENPLLDRPPSGSFIQKSNHSIEETFWETTERHIICGEPWENQIDQNG